MTLITIPEGPTIGTPDRDRRILPAYSLQTEVSRFGTVIGKLAPSAPLLIQLRQAYLLSPEIRPSIDKSYSGEALSMAIGPGEGNKVRVISPVERFVYDKSKNTWQAEGTERRQRVLPSGDQWQTPDGDALAPALASCFWRRDKYEDFAAVGRFSLPGGGPWCLRADWSPGGDGGLGVRAVGVEAERDV